VLDNWLRGPVTSVVCRCPKASFRAFDEDGVRFSVPLIDDTARFAALPCHRDARHGGAVTCPKAHVQAIGFDNPDTQSDIFPSERIYILEWAPQITLTYGALVNEE